MRGGAARVSDRTGPSRSAEELPRAAAGPERHVGPILAYRRRTRPRIAQWPSRSEPGGGRGRVYVPETTKSRCIRRVGIDEATAAALRRWKAVQAQDQLAFGPAWKTDGGLGVEGAWIMTEADACVIHPDTLRARWHRLARMAAVPEIPLHAASAHLRRARARGRYPAGLVSRQLGHAYTSTPRVGARRPGPCADDFEGGRQAGRAQPTVLCRASVSCSRATSSTSRSTSSSANHAPSSRQMWEQAGAVS